MSTAVTRKPPEQSRPLVVGDRNTLETMLQGEAMQRAMADVLPQHVTPKRMVKLALVAASRNPKLLQCTQASVCQALIASSELGLDCSGTTGKAWIIPYGKVATFVPGYRGLIELATRGGEIAYMEARAVYDGEEFEVEYGLAPRLFHKPIVIGQRGALVAAYSVATFKDGNKSFDVMSREDIDRIRARSRASDSGPWATDYAEMARKTPVRRHCKYLPCTPELEAALAILNELDKGTSGDTIIDQPMPELEASTATERLTDKVAPKPAAPSKPTTSKKAQEKPVEAQESSPDFDRGEWERKVWAAESALRDQPETLDQVVQSYHIPNFLAVTLHAMKPPLLKMMVGTLETAVLAIQCANGGATKSE